VRGKKVELRSGPRADGEDGLGSKPYRGPLMQFRVDDEVLDDEPPLPDQLRPLPEWTENIEIPDKPFKWRVSGGTFLDPVWRINGKTFNPDRVETRPELESVVVWKIANGTTVAHMMHLHLTDWYMLSRNGEPPPAHENCLKETFFLDPGDEIVIAGKLSDHTGKYVVHCHMLDHEDHGLMSQFRVVAPSG
jgi:FtsP/CotA-like multicopper oxidase with cupredoxin domain